MTVTKPPFAYGTLRYCSYIIIEAVATCPRRNSGIAFFFVRIFTTLFNTPSPPDLYILLFIILFT